MKRKVVQHGSSSLTVTLPIRWVEKYGIRKGDDLEIEESGSSMIISTQKEQYSPKKEVSTSESGIFTKNNLSHLYQLGYDELEIAFDSPETLDEIKKRLPDCIGFELIDQKKNKVFIKSIATTLESEFDTMLRKSFQVTNEMAKDLLEALEKGDFERLQQIRSMESLNNRFTDFCIRVLNKRGYKIPRRTMQIYEILKNIERIADELKHICDLFMGNKKPDTTSLKNLRSAIDYYFAFYSMFYRFDPALKKKIYSERISLVRKCQESMENSRGVSSLLNHHAINIVEKSYDGAGGYFALVL